MRKQGVAHALSRALLEGRPEDLAVLLVDVEHPRVQALYEDRGFRKAGERRPFPDSPPYAVTFAELPLGRRPGPAPVLLRSWTGSRGRVVEGARAEPVRP